MKFSSYNVNLENHPKQGYTTVYNLLTKECGCYLTSSLSDSPTAKLLSSMKSKGFIIDDDFNELEAVSKLYEEETRMEKKLSVMILLTSQCNCNCTYCYDKNEAETFSNSFDYEKIVSFIDSYIKTSNTVDKIEVIYYGGEPLLMKDTIDEVSSCLSQKYGKQFTFAIITNGTLLDSKDVLRWEHLGLKVLKITIDGNKESHNKRRKYQNGKPTYDDILSNLKKINSEVEIRINTVIDNDVFGFTELLEDLSHINIKTTFSINLTEPCFLSDENKVDLYVRYASELKRRNLFQFVKLAGTHGEICQAKRLHDYVIDGEGNIYPCNAEFNRIGNASDYKFDIKKEYKYKEKCKECKYLPICFGDCPFHETCQKNYFDMLLPRLLKVYIQ